MFDLWIYISTLKFKVTKYFEYMKHEQSCVYSFLIFMIYLVGENTMASKTWCGCDLVGNPMLLGSMLLVGPSTQSS